MLNKRNAFTLLEVIVVVIIIMILATIAVSNYSIAVEKSKLSEGVQILGSVLASAKLYKFEKGSLPNDMADIDLQVSNLTYFNDPVLPGVTTSVVTISRKNGPAYTIGVDIDGVFSCTSTVSGYCGKLGY